jgi:predicted amidohydrolase
MCSGVRVSKTVAGCWIPLTSNAEEVDSWETIESSQLSVKMVTMVFASPNGCLIGTHRQQVLPEAAGEEGETYIAEGAQSD